MGWALTTAVSGVAVLAGAAVFTTHSLVRPSEAANQAGLKPVSLIERRPTPAVAPRAAPVAAIAPMSTPINLSDPATLDEKNPGFQTASAEPSWRMGTDSDRAIAAPVKVAAISSVAIEPQAKIPQNPVRAAAEPPAKIPAKPDSAAEAPSKASPPPAPVKMASRGPSAATPARDPQPAPEQWRVFKSAKASAFNLGGHIDQSGIVDSLASSHLRDAFKTLSNYRKLPQYVRGLIDQQNINLSKIAPYRSLLGIDDKKLEAEQGVIFERISKR